MTETRTVEYKELLDLDDTADKLDLVREIVAMANTAGGTVEVGTRNDGERVGIPESNVKDWDAARIGDAIDRFVAPDSLDIEVRVSSDGCDSGRAVVSVVVEPIANPPIVLARDGNLEGEKPRFRKGDVLIRTSTKVERATRSHYLKWRENLRDRFLEQVQLVTESPESAHVRVVDDDGVRDEVGFMLSRSVDLFRSRPEKLLDASDLLYLFSHREQVDLDADLVPELLVQSALRRRATLFFWLGLADLDPERIIKILHDALEITDRDKSDMAGVVPIVAALYLDPQGYEAVINRMSASSYAHMREAASEFEDRDYALQVVADRRGSTVGDDEPSTMRTDDLLDLADEILAESSATTVSRRLPTIGLEFLCRQLDEAGSAGRSA